MSAQKIFSTLIYSKKLSHKTSHRLNKELLSDIRTIRKLDLEGAKWSKENYVTGYTSYSSIDDLHLRFAPFMELKKHIDREAKAYIKRLNVDLQGRKVEMTTCWINVMPKFTHHSLHLHPLCFISGTYYVQVPVGAGQLKLEDPRMTLFMATPPKKERGYFHVIEPVAGQLVLWESWLRHEVTSNTSSKQRISISFNYEWL